MATNYYYSDADGNERVIRDYALPKHCPECGYAYAPGSYDRVLHIHRRPTTELRTAIVRA